MKRVLLLLFLIYTCSFANEGNSQKGLTYYRFVILPITNIKGTVFTKKHTSKEWSALFKDDAKAFKKEYSSLNKEFEEFLKTAKFKKIAPHIEAFFISYSSDSSSTPECGE